ncbi:unnamed protein product [Closterium sp. Naga37s-1]|nr:unnamed protein product [Closterium sp. Naga37s-1]
MASIRIRYSSNIEYPFPLGTHLLSPSPSHPFPLATSSPPTCTHLPVLWDDKVLPSPSDSTSFPTPRLIPSPLAPSSPPPCTHLPFARDDISLPPRRALPFPLPITPLLPWLPLLPPPPHSLTSLSCGTTMVSLPPRTAPPFPLPITPLPLGHLFPSPMHSPPCLVGRQGSPFPLGQHLLSPSPSHHFPPGSLFP